MPIEEENLKVKKPFIFSYSGQKLGPDWPAISIEDMAISLGRITRFAGHGTRFWPVLLHSLTVSDLVFDEAKGCAILHDSSESLISDLPTPFKTKELKKLEAALLDQILKAHLSEEKYHQYKTIPEIWQAVKIADTEAFLGEIHVLGTKALRNMYPDRSPIAEKYVRRYLRKYSVDDYLRPDGLAVLDFIRRVKDYQ